VAIAGNATDKRNYQRTEDRQTASLGITRLELYFHYATMPRQRLLFASAADCCNTTSNHWCCRLPSIPIENKNPSCR